MEVNLTRTCHPQQYRLHFHILFHIDAPLPLSSLSQHINSLTLSLYHFRRVDARSTRKSIRLMNQFVDLPITLGYYRGSIIQRGGDEGIERDVGVASM